MLHASCKLLTTTSVMTCYPRRARLAKTRQKTQLQAITLKSGLCDGIKFRNSMPEKRTLACLIVDEAMWGFYDRHATVFTWYPVKKVQFALMGQARLRRSKAISHKEARYQRSQCEGAHVKIAVLCILALFGEPVQRLFLLVMAYSACRVRGQSSTSKPNVYFEPCFEVLPCFGA